MSTNNSLSSSLFTCIKENPTSLLNIIYLRYKLQRLHQTVTGHGSHISCKSAVFSWMIASCYKSCRCTSVTSRLMSANAAEKSLVSKWRFARRASRRCRKNVRFSCCAHCTCSLQTSSCMHVHELQPPCCMITCKFVPQLYTLPTRP